MKALQVRGKNKIDKVWTHGNGIYVDDKTSAIVDVIVYNDENNERCVTSRHIEIVPETAGQYIDKMDRKHRRIFEGDIIKAQVFCDYEVHEQIFVVKRGEYGFEPFVEQYTCNGCDCEFTLQEIEVIGNIHDNPELLDRI